MRYEWHLRADLRFDQHILAFYRAGSDRRIIAGYSAFRHGTRIGRSRIQRIGMERWNDPENTACPAATDARSAAFCARCKHSSRLPADAAAPSMMAATAIKATPDMVPEPSSDPRIQANQCFTRRFTLSIPFRPASIKWLPIVFHNMFHTSYVASSKPHRPPCTGHNQQSRISLRRDQHASEQR